MPGQQQMHLHFCVKPNKIWKITVKRQLFCLTYSLQSSTSQRKKKRKWKNTCKNERRLRGIRLQFKM